MTHETFYKWFTTFLQEKGVDMSEVINDQLQIGDVCQAICDSNNLEDKRMIKKKIVYLDFHNQPIEPFFVHLSKALSEKGSQC